MKYNTRTMLKMGKVERYTRAPITELDQWVIQCLREVDPATRLEEVFLVVGWAGRIRVYRPEILNEKSRWAMVADVVYE